MKLKYKEASKKCGGLRDPAQWTEKSKQAGNRLSAELNKRIYPAEATDGIWVSNVVLH